MRVALAQLDAVVGDVAGNAARIDAAAGEARRLGATLVLTPELSLVGYPPRDLLERPDLPGACLDAAAMLARRHADLTLLVGLPRRVEGDPRPLRNSVAVLRGGVIETFADKRLLPSYDVFEEDRFFTPGDRSFVFDHEGSRMGVAICEDLWRAEDAGSIRRYQVAPLADLEAAGCMVVLSPSASPFVRGKHRRHLAQLAAASRVTGAVVVSVNQVGGNDELIFDGGSAVARGGRIEHRLPRFREALACVDLSVGGCVGVDDSEHANEPDAGSIGECFEAIVCGLRGYLVKTGHHGVLLGLSGGIDSAVVAALGVAAVGPERVRAVMMPSRFSSEGSLRDAEESIARLRMSAACTVPIEPIHRALRDALTPAMGPPQGVVDENLQSRVRGTLMMAFANDSGDLLLTTGNKSELAVGYATLYGDMNGGLAPIGDLLKTEVYALARWMNHHHQSLGFAAPPIPEASIEKAPSAELRPDQTDQDSLPPYEALDAVVRAWVEGSEDAARIAAQTGMPIGEVERLLGSIDRAEFKRKQAPPILKLSARAFGRGRPMPLAGRWRPAPPTLA